MLKTENLTKKFKGKEVVNRISFEFENGIYGLLGPNGSGKTTLLRLLTGLYNLDSGTILYNGTNIAKNKKFISNIGYLPQNFGMFKELSVTEAMEMFANLKGIGKKECKTQIEDALRQTNLYEERAKKVKALSGGMIRRLGIAQALLGNPKILIFDEPTAGLDPEERLRFKNIISDLEKNKIVIISTHIVSDVEDICDKILIMNDGKIILNGKVSEIEQYAAENTYWLSDEELQNINNDYIVQIPCCREHNNMTKIIAKENMPFEKAQPNLEDSYILTVKKYENFF